MKLALYFADGFSWQYVEDRPFMEAFWTTRHPLTTLLGYSSTIMPSILAGAPPQETGIWTEYYRDRQPLSKAAEIVLQPRFAKLVTPANLARLIWFRYSRFRGRPQEHRLRLPLQISHQFRRHNIRYDQFPPVGIPVPTLADLFRSKGLRVDFRYLKDGPPTADSQSLARSLSDVDVVFYYDASLDGAGHAVGASAAGLAPQIDKIASFLPVLWEALGGDGDREMLLFSDHGMTNVNRTFDLFDRLKGLTLGTDYLVFMDSTMARFWFDTPDQRRIVLERLRGVPGTLLTPDDKRRLGIDFRDDRYGHEILVAEEGLVYHPNYFPGPFAPWARKYPVRAMHGYLPDAPSSRGICFYRGTRLGAGPVEPLSVTQIHSLVETILSSTVP